MLNIDTPNPVPFPSLALRMLAAKWKPTPRKESEIFSGETEMTPEKVPIDLTFGSQTMK